MKKEERKKRDWVMAAFVAVLILAAALRFFGVYPGYSPYHPDEGKDGYISAWRMYQKGTLEPLEFTYPTLVPLVVLLGLVVLVFPATQLFYVFGHLREVAGAWDKWPAAASKIVANVSDLSMMYWGRYMAAAISLATVILVYFVAKRLLGSRLAGVFAALVLAVNFRAVMASHLDLPDTYSGFFLLLAFWVLLKLWENPSVWWYSLSGLTMGLSFSTKFQVFSFAPFGLLHVVLALKEGKRWWGKVTSLFSTKLFLAMFLLGVTVALVNCYEIVNWSKFYRQVSYASMRYGWGSYILNIQGLSSLYHVILTPAVVFAAVVGGAWLLRRNLVAGGLMLSVIGGFLFYFLYLTSGAVYPRNFVTIIPFFAILAGGGLGGIFEVVGRWKCVGKGLGIGILILVLFQSIENSAVHVKEYMRPWGITTMREWLSKNMEAGKLVAATSTERHILFSMSGLAEKEQLGFVPISAATVYYLPEIAETGADWAVINLDLLGDSAQWWMLSHETDWVDRWYKPTEIGLNVGMAVATRQLVAHGVFAAVKPWQAPDNNYVAVRVPPVLKFDPVMLASYTFDGEEGWNEIDGWKGGGDNLALDEKEGRKGKGSLMIKGTHVPYPVVRWVSPVFEVEQGKAYRVFGWVRAGGVVDKERRDGFLRIDFYDKKPEKWDEGTGSRAVAVSSRYYGGDWEELKVEEVAPAGSRWATVSFQLADLSGTDFWLDDMKIEASREEVSWPGKDEEGKLVVDNDVLIPNLGCGF